MHSHEYIAFMKSMLVTTIGHEARVHWKSWTEYVELTALDATGDRKPTPSSL